MPDKFIEASKETLMRRMREEYRRDYLLPVQAGLTELLALVGNLELALRHPATCGQP